MARYPLNMPVELKREAERLAAMQGVSLNQFIEWALAEKVGELRRSLDDPLFPRVTYARGAAGRVTPLLRGTRIRVQTVTLAHHAWGMPAREIAAEYDLTEEQVGEALRFYEAHREEVDGLIAADRVAEPANG